MIQLVNNFNDLISTPFHNRMNAICWKRELQGDFSEIVNKLKKEDGVILIDREELLALELGVQGQLAREVILTDWKLLEEQGAQPVLNIISHYERDDSVPFFPTDVYSFHVDRAPVPTSTYLCTYYGEPSDIVPNAEVEQKVMIPSIREELLNIYGGSDDEGFEEFLTDNFFDLHYQEKPDANITSLGWGNLWRLACDVPGSSVLPCVHRAPKEKAGEPRLLLIC